MTQSKVALVDERPGWDEYFLGICASVAARADCRRSRVGAVLVGDSTHWIYGTGYNGVKPGQAGCLAGRCPRGLVQHDVLPVGGEFTQIQGYPCIATHAEENALLQAEHRFTQTYGANLRVEADEPLTLFCTRKCCSSCEEKLRIAGVGRIVWQQSEFYHDSLDISPTKM